MDNGKYIVSLYRIKAKRLKRVNKLIQIANTSILVQKWIQLASKRQTTLLEIQKFQDYQDSK